jgi:hypothetical protein
MLRTDTVLRVMDDRFVDKLALLAMSVKRSAKSSAPKLRSRSMGSWAMAMCCTILLAIDDRDGLPIRMFDFDG